jgi:hypothetical protein
MVAREDRQAHNMKTRAAAMRNTWPRDETNDDAPRISNNILVRVDSPRAELFVTNRTAFLWVGFPGMTGRKQER